MMRWVVFLALWVSVLTVTMRATGGGPLGAGIGVLAGLGAMVLTLGVAARVGRK